MFFYFNVSASFGRATLGLFFVVCYFLRSILDIMLVVIDFWKCSLKTLYKFFLFIYFLSLHHGHKMFHLIHRGHQIFYYVVTNIYNICWSIMDIKCLCFCHYILCLLIHHGHRIFSYAFANIYNFCWSIMDIEYFAMLLPICTIFVDPSWT